MHNLKTLFGHEQGYERVSEFITSARKTGIQFVTVWVFSTENWKRKQDEVDDLMNLVTRGLSKIHTDAKKEKIRVVHIGRRDRVSKKLLTLMEEVEEETKGYDNFTLCLAIDYGGEDELERAGKLLKESPDTDKAIGDFLDMKRVSMPHIDLVIRTGGERRTSGFLPIQSSYAEWIFEDSLLPDFDEVLFLKALKEYDSRTRRFGA